jgi:hypothetical protein
LAQVSVEVCAVRLLQSCAQTKVGQFDVTTGVEQEVVWFDIPESKFQIKILVNLEMQIQYL